MAVVPAVLSQKVKAIANAQSALDEARKELASAVAYEAEMTRQYGEKNGEGDTYNANILYPKMMAARAELTRIQGVVTNAQNILIAAQKDYDNYINNLDPEDKAALNELAVNNSKTELLATSQVTTKYLIFGAIALTIIIGIVVIIRSKKNLA